MSAWFTRLRLGPRDKFLSGNDFRRLEKLVPDFEGLRSIDRSAASGGRSRISPDQLLDCIEQVYAAGRSDEALRLMGQRSFADYGAPGRACLASPDVRALLHTINELAPLLDLPGCLRTKRRAAGGLAISIELMFDDNRLASATSLTMQFYKFHRLLTDYVSALLPADMHGEIEPDEVVRVEGAEMIIDTPILSASARKSRTNFDKVMKPCRRMTREIEDIYLQSGIRRIMLDKQPLFPTLNDVAVELGLSTRTLRRRLEGQGTSFIRLLEDVRFELAVHYLGTSSFTTETIAQRLGYSESANFRHAFRRWTGSSPRHFQRSFVEPTSPVAIGA